jgi:flagellar export protein FliJ
MKPFKFTLEAVRTVREREEQRALHDYVATLRALEEARRRVEVVDEEMGRAWGEFRQSILGSCSAAEIARIGDYCEMLARRKRDLEASVQAARVLANRAFTRYLAAHQACTVVEKCYENQRDRHHRDRRKHEQKTLDDLAQRSLTLASLVMRSRGTIWN